MNITVKTITAKKEFRLETKILNPAKQTTAIIAATSPYSIENSPLHQFFSE